MVNSKGKRSLTWMWTKVRSLVFLLAAGAPFARGQAEQAGPLVTPLRAENLDPAAFLQWVDGVEKPMPQRDGPRHVIWTTATQPEWDGVLFGDSKIPGPRHLRIGVKTPITVGSVLVRAGGQVSMLRPTAPYPGDLADESQWIPAERIARSPGADPRTADEQYVLWVFPKAAQTRALRFTHTARPADSRFAGWLGGAYVLLAADGQRGPCGNRRDRRQRRGRRADQRRDAITACGPRGTTARKASPRPVSPRASGGRVARLAAAGCDPRPRRPLGRLRRGRGAELRRPGRAARRARPPRPTGGPSHAGTDSRTSIPAGWASTGWTWGKP